MKVDYLIIGQGIAGSVMALTLEQRGKTVAIMGQSERSASSRIAAGVYNPFNFRRTVPVWKAGEATTAARNFYSWFESVSGARFHTLKRIVRLFGSETESAEWKAYLADPGKKFAFRGVQDPAELAHLLAPWGTGMILAGGILNTELFLQAARTHFSNRGYYLEEACDHSRFAADGYDMVYDARIEATRVIFCEGHLAVSNPFFAPKTIVPTKGELIHVSIPGLNVDAVLNGPVYLAPLGDDRYVCGATFNPGKADEEITAAGKEELIRKLRTMIDLPFEVIAHYAGVRPAGRDRKPVIGRSRQHWNFSIFNGFGSKAVLYAPLLAQVLADHLENGAELLPEVNVARFKVY